MTVHQVQGDKSAIEPDASLDLTVSDGAETAPVTASVAWADSPTIESDEDIIDNR